MKIHKEGYKVILSFLLVIIIVVIVINYFFLQQQWWHFAIYLVLLVLLSFVLQFFRCPQPEIIKNKKLPIVSNVIEKVVILFQK